MTANTNFATFNPLSNQEGNGAIGSASDDLSRGNTKFNVTNGSSGMAVTIATPPSGGKWYCEFYISGSVGNYAWVGYYPVKETPEVKEQWVPSSNVTWTDSGLVSVHSMGRYFYTDGQYTDSGATSFTAGDVISIALDLDNGATYFAKNGTYMNSGNPASGASKTGAAPVEGAYSKEYLFAVGSAGSSGHAWTINAGQDSTFGGNLSAGGNTDSAGFGDFKYSVPSGYKAVCSANIPANSDIDPSGDNGSSQNPTQLFNVIQYTGNASTNAITGLGFKPDLVWIQNNSSQNQTARITDSSRGATKSLEPAYTGPEATESGVTSFDTDGFTLGSQTGGYNTSSATYIAWCWRANGGTTSSNGNGSITSNVQANPAGNFSIITYSGTGSNATIGHGMTKKPAFIIVKNTSDTDHWAIYHESMTADFYTAFTGSIFSNNATFWNDTEPTTSVISIGTNNRVNGSGDNHVCYAWAQEEGYMKFGTFEGNGNSFGPFVYTGFRPRLIYIKKNANSADWHVFDSRRNSNNPVNTFMLWDTDGGDDTAASNTINFLSNGFKLKNTASALNANGSTYVYGAWGDIPFKTHNSF